MSFAGCAREDVFYLPVVDVSSAFSETGLALLVLLTWTQRLRQLANYHHIECPYDNWVILLLGDFSAPGKHPSGGFTRADGRVRDRG